VRRGSIVQLIVIGVLAGAIASAFALIPNWLPEPASKEAGRIDFVFWFVTGICIFVFSIVAAVSVFAVWKFRAKPDDDSDGAPIHGHTGLEIAWTAVPTLLVTSIAVVSAIVLAKDEKVVGVGAGQMSRLDSAFIAVRKAGERAKGAVVASDAFFPFPDALETCLEAGATAVIQPGGSIRDEEVISVARKRNIPMVLTGMRHFKH